MNKEMVDVLQSNYKGEQALQVRVKEAISLIQLKEQEIGTIYYSDTLASAMENHIENGLLPREDFKDRIIADLNIYAAQQHREEMKTRFDDIENTLHGLFDKSNKMLVEVKRCIGSRDYKHLGERMNAYHESLDQIALLYETKEKIRLEERRQSDMNQLKAADAWVPLDKPIQYATEYGNINIAYKLTDNSAEQLTSKHTMDVSYPNGFYLGTVNNNPQLILKSERAGLIISSEMTDDYMYSKGLEEITEHMWFRYKDRVQIKDYEQEADYSDAVEKVLMDAEMLQESDMELEL